MVLGNINIHAQNPDFLFMVEYAIKAPSGHNTQPWLFRINENSIEIYPNFDRALPVVDFDNRELFISLGCALENLCITALEKGYDYDVETKSLSINEEGAEVVRYIFDRYVAGYSLFVVICYLYCRSEPVDPEEFSDAFVDFLCFTLWISLIFGPGRFRPKSSCG